MGGKLIVIEGLDGSGKATQTKLLYEAMSKGRERVRLLSFPCYADASSALVRMYLGGEFGQNPGDVNAYAASVFYAADRYASYKKYWQQEYKDGYIFLADRYTTSNAVHQTGKLPREKWDRYLDWLLDFEYNLMGIPRPDAVIYLDMPAEASEKLISKRYIGDENKKDIHEKDIGFQRNSREAALYCAQRHDWTLVECGCSESEVRPAADIAKNVLEIVRGVIC